MKTILVIDGQGGRLGSELVEKLLKLEEEFELIGIGTNSLATQAMIKAGCNMCATGENPVVFNSKTADLIIGPIGIVIANSLLGEITPNMARAVGESPGKKILIPINKCDNFVIAAQTHNFKDLVDMAIEKVKQELA